MCCDLHIEPNEGILLGRHFWTSAQLKMLFINIKRPGQGYKYRDAMGATDATDGRNRIRIRLLTWNRLFLMLVDLSEKERRRAGGSSLRDFSTNPPRPSSRRLSRSAAGSPPGPPLLGAAASLRSDVIDERMLVLGRNREAMPKGALVRTP